MRNRADLCAPGHNTNRQYNLPESGTQSAYKANRDGGAERFVAPVVQNTLAVALALLPHEDPLLTDLALALIKAAQPHDAHTRYLWHTVPGIGKLLSLGLLYAIHALARCPRGQACVSSCRLGKCAKASAGHRWGPSGKKIGKAHLPWAFAAAAVWCRRTTPAGQKPLARLEPKPGKGQALPILAHKLARAVYSLRKRQTALDMAKCLHGEGSRAGEPDA